MGILENSQKNINDGIFLNSLKTTPSEMKTLSNYNFLTLKPTIYICNVDESSIKSGNNLSNLVRDYAEKKNPKVF